MSFVLALSHELHSKQHNYEKDFQKEWKRLLGEIRQEEKEVDHGVYSNRSNSLSKDNTSDKKENFEKRKNLFDVKVKDSYLKNYEGGKKINIILPVQDLQHDDNDLKEEKRFSLRKKELENNENIDDEEESIFDDKNLLKIVGEDENNESENIDNASTPSQILANIAKIFEDVNKDTKNDIDSAFARKKRKDIIPKYRIEDTTEVSF